MNSRFVFKGEMKYSNLPNEIWKHIEGADDNYEVSNLGRIRNTKTQRILSQGVNESGYLSTIVKSNGKVFKKKTHRVVATAFIPNPNNLPEINHIDWNPMNNCVENIEWCSREYNNKYKKERVEKNYSGKIFAKDDKGNLVHTFNSTKEAKESGFNRSSVKCAYNNKYFGSNYYRGLYWYREFSREDRERLKEEKETKRILHNTVVVLDKNGNFIKEYSSQTEASKELGISCTQINSSISRKTKIIEGKWIILRKSDYIEGNYNLPTRTRYTRKVNQIDPNTGEVLRTFDSIEEAKKFLGTKSNNISDCCGKKKYFNTVAGYKWSYAN